MLTELQVKNAKPREKTYRLPDSRGLYLRVIPSGGKYWVLRYWEDGKEHMKGLGAYPDITLRDARIMRDEIQMGRSKGVSPVSPVGVSPVLFGDTVKEWMKIRMEGKAETYRRTILFRLNKYVLPALGTMKLADITSAKVLELCRSVEDRGHAETAKRVRVIVGQVFRFAIASGWAENDPTSALRGALRPKTVQHYATMDQPEEIALLMRAVAAYPYTVMRCAVLFSIYTFARPGEVRSAEWSEIRGDLWDIPAGKMKMKRRHLVPLSTQAQAVLDELRPITGKGRFLFPSPRNDGRCMSENGVRVALRAMGFGKDQITPHGFRSMLSTIANENGWNRDVIERQLAHVETNAVRGAYNHAEYLPERRRLMQWWGDYLDGLRE
ncbi:MAG: tyrosine-type recombinase/integrase [Fretibacterium sp.]|nr:tyrosine-type recombinase/integrase [Fretibacterium sp.]